MKMKFSVKVDYILFVKLHFLNLLLLVRAIAHIAPLQTSEPVKPVCVRLCMELSTLLALSQV